MWLSIGEPYFDMHDVCDLIEALSFLDKTWPEHLDCISSLTTLCEMQIRLAESKLLLVLMSDLCEDGRAGLISNLPSSYLFY